MKSEQTRREFLKCTAAIAVARAFRPQTSAARITTIAGTGLPGTASDGSDAAVTSINNPFGLVIGPDGALYWADFGSNRVLRLDLTTKKITVVAGNGTKGHSGDGGPAKSAQLSAPHEVRFDSKGNIFVAERDSHVVRYIETSTGFISTAAGTGTAGYQGDGGPANRAQLAQPHSIALDKADNVYICDIMQDFYDVPPSVPARSAVLLHPRFLLVEVRSVVGEAAAFPGYFLKSTCRVRPATSDSDMTSP